MRWNQDHTDILCSEWARVRRRIYGIVLDSKIEPKELLGKLRCTIGQVHEEGEGASQASTINQNFPEVYTGDSLLVHRCYQTFEDELRLTMEAQYVFRELSVKVKAHELRFTVTDYWRNLKQLKRGVSSYLKGRADERELIGRSESAVSTQSNLQNGYKALQCA